MSASLSPLAVDSVSIVRRVGVRNNNTTRTAAAKRTTTPIVTGAGDECGAHTPLSLSSAAATPVAVKPVGKLETLSDRLDQIAIGAAVALVVCALVEQWPVAQIFTHGDAWLLSSHTWSAPVISIGLYLAMVHLLGPALRDTQTPLVLEVYVSVALKYWNLLLALLSICMMLGLGAPLVSFYWRYGLYETLCDGSHLRWKGPAVMWLYVFTLSKYVELVDTAFMVLRRKPVSFLHWYHHASVLAYTWFAMAVGYAPGWIFATVNSAIHTIMYFYYYRAACGARLTYDKWITAGQIAQMVIGILVTISWAVLRYGTSSGATTCPCVHAHSVMASALFMYGTYFALFLSFYFGRYRSSQMRKKSKEKSAQVHLSPYINPTTAAVVAVAQAAPTPADNPTH